MKVCNLLYDFFKFRHFLNLLVFIEQFVYHDLESFLLFLPRKLAVMIFNGSFKVVN